jgi:hypothetical protein
MPYLCGWNFRAAIFDGRAILACRASVVPRPSRRMTSRPPCPPWPRNPVRVVRQLIGTEQGRLKLTPSLPRPGPVRVVSLDRGDSPQAQPAPYPTVGGVLDTTVESQLSMTDDEGALCAAPAAGVERHPAS